MLVADYGGQGTSLWVKMAHCDAVFYHSDVQTDEVVFVFCFEMGLHCNA